MRGANVCRLHGGSAPQVKAAAQRRILAAADLAAAHLIEFMTDHRVPHPVRLAAARDLLDRAGLSARTTVEVEVQPWQRLIDEILVDPRDLPTQPTEPQARPVIVEPEPRSVPTEPRAVEAPVPARHVVPDKEPPVTDASLDEKPPGWDVEGVRLHNETERVPRRRSRAARTHREGA